MILTIKKQADELQLTGKEIRALGQRVRRPAVSAETGFVLATNNVRIPTANTKQVLQPISRIAFVPTVRRVETIFTRVEKLPNRIVNGRSAECYRLEPRERVITEKRDDSLYSFKVEDESGKKIKTRTESQSTKTLRWKAYIESREYSFRRLIRRRAAEYLARATIQPSKWLAATIRDRREMLRGAVRALPPDASIPGLCFSLESAKSDEFRRNPKEKHEQWPLWPKDDIYALRARMRAKDHATDCECRIVSALVCRGETVESARDFVLSLRNGRSVASATEYHLNVVPKRTAQSLMLRFRDV